MSVVAYLSRSLRHLIFYGRLTVWLRGDYDVWQERSMIWFKRGFCAFGRTTPANVDCWATMTPRHPWWKRA